MDTNILILVSISFVLVLLTYLLTKRASDQKVKEYKSLDEALTKIKQENENLDASNKSLKVTIEKAKNELQILNTEMAELLALKRREDSLKLSIKEKEDSLEIKSELLNELGEKSGKVSIN
nr:hypothetical protein [Photobacterium leiognathi]